MAANRITSKCTSLVLALAIVLSSLSAHAEESAGGMTLQELKEKYPRARFVQVSLQEFEQIYSNYPGRNIVLVESTNNAGFQEVDVRDMESAKTNGAPASILLIEPEQTQPDEPKPPVPGRHASSRPYDPYAPHDTCVGFDIFGDIDVGSDEVAIVIFVLVGVVVVAASVLYVGYYAYDVLANGEDYEYWGDSGLRAGFLTGGDRSGGLYGLRVAGGFWGGGAMDVGLAGEVGYMDVRVAIEDQPMDVRLSGLYGLAGPCLRWVLDGSDNPVCLVLDVLAGTADDSHVGLMSKASANLSWGIGPHARLGLQIGSLYMKLNEDEGPLNTDSDFNLMLGVDVGWRF